MGKARDERGERGHGEGLRQVSLQLGGACRPCPERGSGVASACLCPCQVAVARRFLSAAAETGEDPALLDTGRRGALRLQAWAVSGPATTCDLPIVERALEGLEKLHPACELPGCLTCEAVARLRGLLAVNEVGSVA